MKKYLITGAAGFIGSHLVELLLQEGIKPSQLILIIKPGESRENLPKLNLKIIEADIRNKKKIFEVVQGVNVIYHLAARIDFDGKTYAEYKDVNVDATEYLLAAAVKNKVKKFIFFSSIGVYGLPAGVGTINGWDETHQFTFSNFYGQSKFEGEELVRKYHKKFNLAYAIIRPASVYGPREKGPTLALYKAIKNHQFLMIGSGENRMHYVFVKDLVSGARLAELSSKKNGEYILAGPEPTPFKEIIEEVALSINMHINPIRLPIALALAVSYICQAISFITGISLPLFPSRVRTMSTEYWYKIDKAKLEIKYLPKVSFRQGAAITGKWYQNKGWL